MAKVLVVDDDAAQLQMRRMLLEHFGYKVETAESEEAAVLAEKEFGPDCVVMDLRLPELEDGLRLIRRLKEARAGLPLIVMSGWVDDLGPAPEMRQVKRVLQKPVRTEVLMSEIRRSCEEAGE
jgi:CheY-like chemotaxis protein